MTTFDNQLLQTALNILKGLFTQAIFVMLKLQLQNCMCKPGAICCRNIAGVSNMFETWCNFAATKWALKHHKHTWQTKRQTPGWKNKRKFERVFFGHLGMWLIYLIYITRSLSMLHHSILLCIHNVIAKYIKPTCRNIRALGWVSYID